MPVKIRLQDVDESLIWYFPIAFLIMLSRAFFLQTLL